MMPIAPLLGNALEPIFSDRPLALITSVSLGFSSICLALLLIGWLSTRRIVSDARIWKKIGERLSPHTRIALTLFVCGMLALGVASGRKAYSFMRTDSSAQAQNLASIIEGNHFSVRLAGCDAEDARNARKYCAIVVSEVPSVDSTQKLFGRSVGEPTPHWKMTLSWRQAVRADSIARAVSHGRLALSSLAAP